MRRAFKSLCMCFWALFFSTGLTDATAQAQRVKASKVYDLWKVAIESPATVVVGRPFTLSATVSTGRDCSCKKTPRRWVRIEQAHSTA